LMRLTPDRGDVAQATMEKDHERLDDRLKDLKDEVGGMDTRRTGSPPVPKPSVWIDPERCVGCAACMRDCPTEAIRIGRDGKALIRPGLCVDCGVCIRVCGPKAVSVLADSLASIHSYRYRIAVPEPSLYGQFVPSVLPEDILAGILDLGFQEVYEVAVSTEKASLLLKDYLSQYRGPKPLVTSFCPVTVRLIQLKFPEVMDRVIPVDFILELDIRRLKEQRARELGIPIELIGAFYLSGCPSRIANVHHPYTGGRSYLDGAISIGEIYRDLMFAIRARQKTGVAPPVLQRASGLGIRWGTLGGEVEALGLKSAFAVSDVKHVVKVLEEMENQKLSQIEFVECRGCYGGCTGGPLVMDNPYMGRAKVQMLGRMFTERIGFSEDWGRENIEHYRPHLDRRFAPPPREGLDPDRARAIRKLAQRAKILKKLPGIDCGICGAPTCRALADDIVRGEARVLYCFFKLRDSFLRQKGRRAAGQRLPDPSRGRL
jgi:ferredoxin